MGNLPTYFIDESDSFVYQKVEKVSENDRVINYVFKGVYKYRHAPEFPTVMTNHTLIVKRSAGYKFVKLSYVGDTIVPVYAKDSH
jgi:hypothetical protein